MSGSVCLDVINQTWSPVFDLVNVFEVFLPQLLLYPNASDPLNGEVAALLMRDKPSYEQRVKDDPKAAADSILPLLEKAEKVVPQEMRQKTSVKVGATAGLRQLGVDASERILQAVKDFLKVKSSLKSNDDWVTVLDGTQEGAYQWVTINYLLKRLGKKYSDTVGVVNLGGRSVQMAYAITEADAAKAPKISNGEDTYVKEMFLMGTKYYLYVHRFASSLFE